MESFRYSNHSRQFSENSLRQLVGLIPPPLAMTYCHDSGIKGLGASRYVTAGERKHPFPLSNHKPHPVSEGGSSLRMRSSSLSSLSSRSSSMTSPSLPAAVDESVLSSDDFHFEDLIQSTSGNIFCQREDLRLIQFLPRHHRNPYSVQTTDDGPHGTDQSRRMVLGLLARLRVTSLPCVVCRSSLVIFDAFPLIDGTLFLSPMSHNPAHSSFTSSSSSSSSSTPSFSASTSFSSPDVEVNWCNRRLFLNAICIQCLSGTDLILRCRNCSEIWMGNSYRIGSVYTYDIFAALPCCSWRLGCSHCGQSVFGQQLTNGHFSDYSRRHRCPHCAAEDHHFIRPLGNTFSIEKKSRLGRGRSNDLTRSGHATVRLSTHTSKV